MENKIPYPLTIDDYFSPEDHRILKERWNELDATTQQVVIMYAKPTTSQEFLLELDVVIKHLKFNNKLEGILNE